MEEAINILAKALLRHKLSIWDKIYLRWRRPSEAIDANRLSTEYDWVTGWRPMRQSTAPAPESIGVLRKILYSHFPGKDFVYLGPFTGEWRRAVEEALGRRIPAIDASRKYLRGYVDPYSASRLKYNRDVWDYYPLGIASLGLGNRVRITYEFTPCMSSAGYAGCVLEAVPHGGFVYMYRLLDILARRVPRGLGAKYNVYILPARLPSGRPTKVEAHVITPEENPHLVLAGKIYNSILHSSPFAPKERIRKLGTEEIRRALLSLLGTYPPEVARNALKAIAYYLNLKGGHSGLGRSEYQRVLEILRQV